MASVDRIRSFYLNTIQLVRFAFPLIHHVSHIKAHNITSPTNTLGPLAYNLC